MTLDPETAPAGLDDQYRHIEPLWGVLQKYLVRGWVEGNVPPMRRFDYVTVLEQHATGRPHVNVIVHSPALADHLRCNPPTENDVRRGWGPRWFRTLVAHVGWGPMSYIGHAKSKDDVASYVTKFDKGRVSHPTLVGEVVKSAQLPIMAPRRTRRLRSSKRFLPPARLPTHPDWTGTMEQLPTPEDMKAVQGERHAELEAHLGEPLPVRPVEYEWLGRREVRLSHVERRTLRRGVLGWAEETTTHRAGTWHGWQTAKRNAAVARPWRGRELQAYARALGRLRAHEWRRAVAEEKPELRAWREAWCTWPHLPAPEWMRPVRQLDGLASLEPVTLSTEDRFQLARYLAAKRRAETPEAWAAADALRPSAEVLELWHAEEDDRERAEAAAGLPAVDVGTAQYQPPEPPRTSDDDGRYLFGKDLTARFEYFQAVSEAMARGEDPAKVKAPRGWRLRMPLA
ncbi:hypothetical protein [Myxococcus sp. RHSTA-1-4]|uniref:hypothetical protein n=1 Tax=Myxococcus sp. RHSTA-1-4 TaxID=2874601 RepID=UPI001CC01519|nr:hypothetical protein [Myxococcus sp. RHSTA-1-4]MBZ4422016.1 hypothetical protein [Myxococcus sp. RHSTA-1-4]